MQCFKELMRAMNYFVHSRMRSFCWVQSQNLTYPPVQTQHCMSSYRNTTMEMWSLCKCIHKYIGAFLKTHRLHRKQNTLFAEKGNSTLNSHKWKTSR